MLLHPLAFGEGAGFELAQVAVAQQGVVIAGVDNRHVGRHAFKQVFGQVGDVFQRDGDHDKLAVLRRFLGRNGRGAGFGGHVFQCFGTARVGDKHRVAEASEPNGEGAANVTGPNDSNFHLAKS